MKYPDPPKKVTRILEWFCPPELFESIYGDLYEKFIEDIEYTNIANARKNYFWNVFRFFRPGIVLRNNFNLKINNLMFNSYLKIATRQLAKRKLYSFINAFGLSIGIAFAILIYLFIKDESKFDQFHQDKELIYNIALQQYNTWDPNPEKPYRRSAYVQFPLRGALKDEVPEIAYVSGLNAGARHVVKHKDKIFTEKSICYVDQDFFNIFSFPILQGKKDELLTDKHNVVITPRIAKKYFGTSNPLGQSLEIDINGDFKDFIVTGVIEEAPPQSSISFDILINITNRKNNTSWRSYSVMVLAKLHENANPKHLQYNLDKIVEKYLKDAEAKARERYGIPDDMLFKQYIAVPFTEVHLDTELGWPKSSDPKYAMILGGIGILILLIACINYITLALTTSATRRVEVGIRKVIGAKPGQLFQQFSLESVILAFISLLIAIGFVLLFIPAFNQFTNKEISLHWFQLFEMAAVGFVIAIVIGLLAGSYPAVFLVKYQPSKVLKGGASDKLKAGFTKPLVVLQYAISIFLIISSVIMFRQMKYITTKDLGYNKDQVVVIPTNFGWNEASTRMVTRYKNALANETGVISVAGTSTSFGNGWSKYGFEVDGESKSAIVYMVDPNYINTLELTLVEGRNFDPSRPADSSAVIVNQALVAEMGWENPLEEYINWRGDSTSPGYPVIGVVKDYHNLSLEKNIEPLFLTLEGPLTNLLVKIKPDNIPATMAVLKEKYKTLAPDKPFNYTFLDEDVAKQYESYRRWMSITSLSTAFAILISCLGLFGLSGINAVNRTKEIGIRKVLGADMSNIFVLLNRQFVILALLSFLIAAPLSWYIMRQWLSDFEFAIAINWELFALSLGAGLVIAIITVSYHAIKSAMINPADTLKTE